MVATSEKYRVFLDGICHLCSLEALWLKKYDTNHTLEFIDIADSNFSAESYGLSKKAVDTEMHIICPNGKILHGIPALIEIYHLLPRFQWLSKLLGFPLVYPFAKIGYFIFSRSRPYLPKRKTSIFCGLK
ncbi:MAG: putative thiol-disulfide oxidoreductase YuxK, family [Bacteriovoracaceae bacterium]|nr:putative thiol-disulfide oxidoreductase YuxK, family [Bacteriovoracaceae bacterium]